MKELKLNNSNRVALAHDGITPMAQQETDAMIGVNGRWWCFPGAQLDGDSWEGEWRSDGKVYLHDCVWNVVEGTKVDNPEVLAVTLLPLKREERRRREILLTRVMLVAIDIVLAGEPLGLETARDLLREVRHTYPELLDESL